MSKFFPRRIPHVLTVIYVSGREETRLRAREYVEEALQWSIEDGYVRSITLTDNWGSHDRLNLHVALHMTNGELLTLRVNYETGEVYVL